MAGKTDFSAQEWGRILSAPLLAGLAVSLAEPSGLIGMLKEGMASAAVEAELSGDNRAEVKRRARAGLGEIGALLDAKAPQDAPAFKGWLETIAGKVAAAASEGGFLGFGGVPVTDAERATIAEIAAALKTSA